MNSNFVKTVVENGGSLHPIIIPASETGGTGLMNPSIYNDNGKLIMNLRHVNYTLYHAEGNQMFINRWGPLAYLHPENDMHLRTINYYCEITDDLQLKSYSKIDTSKFDKEPLWEFVGLEDGRLVRWNDKLYIVGVRRDTTTHGEGRMEMSELEIRDGQAVEVNRSRIPPPVDPHSYCEKNWMVVTDQPNQMVKWTNPTEVVEADPENLKCKQVAVKNGVGAFQNMRGSSHVIPYKGKRVCIIHEVDLFKNRLDQKDGKYTHRLVVWDNDWNIEFVSDPFSFMGGEIEFCCGLAEHNDDLLISFGFQDNAAYILRVPKTHFDGLIGIKNDDPILINPVAEEDQSLLDSWLTGYMQNPFDQEVNFGLGLVYEDMGQTASATSFYLRSVEYGSNLALQYEALLRLALCFEKQGNRIFTIKGVLLRAISLLPYRPEAHFLLSRVYERCKDWQEGYTAAVVGLEMATAESTVRSNVEYPGRLGLKFQKAVCAWWIGLWEESYQLFQELKETPLPKIYLDSVDSNLKTLTLQMQTSKRPG